MAPHHDGNHRDRRREFLSSRMSGRRCSVNAGIIRYGLHYFSGVAHRKDSCGDLARRGISRDGHPHTVKPSGPHTLIRRPSPPATCAPRVCMATLPVVRGWDMQSTLTRPTEGCHPPASDRGTAARTTSIGTRLAATLASFAPSSRRIPLTSRNSMGPKAKLATPVPRCPGECCEGSTAHCKHGPMLMQGSLYHRCPVPFPRQEMRSSCSGSVDRTRGRNAPRGGGFFRGIGADWVSLVDPGGLGGPVGPAEPVEAVEPVESVKPTSGAEDPINDVGIAKEASQFRNGNPKRCRFVAER